MTMTKTEHRRAIRGYETPTLRAIASDLAKTAQNPTEPAGWWMAARYQAVVAELEARGPRAHAKPIHRIPRGARVRRPVVTIHTPA